ncbi:hypothetical protein MPSEU_000708400 [Mayamaea pseudoterrestris]|nr:hypothetical protein MPSEU_000708400 [Mayamaea pseudoterrestris]
MVRRNTLEDSEDEDVKPVIPVAARKNRKRINERQMDSDDDDDDDQDMTEAPDDEPCSSSQFGLSSQFPEASQAIKAVKSSEQAKLFDLTEEKREQTIADLTRTVLFKALAHESIDRVKCAKEAGVDGTLSSAIYEQAQIRLNNIFGFELKKIPAFMEKMKDLPAKYENRYYLVNPLSDQQGANHKRLLSVHDEVAKLNGLLMIVLSLIYCQGSPRADGSRWIPDQDLFALLHSLDDNIPSEPLDPGSKKKRMVTQSSQANGGKGTQSPDVDAALDLFEKRDYILKMKSSDINPKLDEGHHYAMGPRAMLEIGRKQVIYFCSEIMDEDVDPQMLKELDAEGDGEE